MNSVYTKFRTPPITSKLNPPLQYKLRQDRYPQMKPSPPKKLHSRLNVTSLHKQALLHHNSGRLDDAEIICNKILFIDSRHSNSLHLLGVIAIQRRNYNLAVELISKAISINCSIDTFHFNLGSALFNLGKLSEAVIAYKNALSITPDFLAALSNLGVALYKQGRFSEAVERFEQCLFSRSENAEVLSNLGNVLSDQGKLDEAIACYQKAITIKPSFPGALTNLGNTLNKKGLHADAISQHLKALAISPNMAEALTNLCNSYYREGAYYKAMKTALQTLQVKETSDIRTLFCLCLKFSSFEPYNFGELNTIHAYTVRALNECWAGPREFATPSLNLIRKNPDYIELTAAANSNLHNDLSQSISEIIHKLSSYSELFKILLKSAVVPQNDFEILLTNIRHRLLIYTTSGQNAYDEYINNFSCVLAQQCFINEYVFSVTPDESSRIELLKRSIESALIKQSHISSVQLATLAAYIPLHTIQDPRSLLSINWPDSVRELLKQQVLEPFEESHLRSCIPNLTPIHNGVSLKVRNQYEDNPYPRWIKAPKENSEVSIESFLHKYFPTSEFTNTNKTDDLDILIAGCGTGLQSILTAQLFPNSRVLAIDLSLTSISYAMRKTHELGLTNIEYAQADIINLSSIDKRFDVIESVGVLHHLADPWQGWRILLSLLRPRGFMKLGFYSELARQGIVAARSFIADQGYPSNQEGIRQCRQDLRKKADNPLLSTVLNSSDFYSTSMCRDLIFHVQEHRLTLPQIDAFLTENKLSFIGFNTYPQTMQAYRKMFPQDKAMSNLNNWNQYEAINPSTFIEMYQFWVQRT